MMNYVTMDYKFLNRVVDQLVRETRIDYDEGRLYTPFLSPLSLILPPPLLFSQHCKEVYGLNEDEIDYVWRGYKVVIRDKTKNNG